MADREDHICQFEDPRYVALTKKNGLRTHHDLRSVDDSRATRSGVRCAAEEDTAARVRMSAPKIARTLGAARVYLC